eukprot:CAMPEP_0117672988 /NCGR_PEP_ID=MMETSP0804-20121206/14223_1 /TAXON_ID=1074897 /ORGANISM="Tetraselmis astigmatica, Strain CCMP880" /LENGTH=43 /DNA_ID= /DNA_START= /DNA_END= /DNA_ORIENTATION=
MSTRRYYTTRFCMMGSDPSVRMQEGDDPTLWFDADTGRLAEGE